MQEFNRDNRPLVFLDTSVVREAFLYHESRKVDKGGCISFQGRRYETKTQLIGRTVEIAYVRSSPEIITVTAHGMEPFQVRPLKIGEYCEPRSQMPREIQKEEPETSRFLDVLEKQHKESARRCADAISFGAYKREV